MPCRTIYTCAPCLGGTTTTTAGSTTCVSTVSSASAPPPAPAPAPAPPPTDAPEAEPLQNGGKDCWDACNAKQGPCEFCGGGVCCRKGHEDKSNGCDGNLGVDGKGHVCVAAGGGAPPTPATVSSDVSCGEIRKPTCAECTEIGSDANQEEFCQGDCMLQDGQCIRIASGAALRASPILLCSLAVLLLAHLA